MADDAFQDGQCDLDSESSGFDCGAEEFTLEETIEMERIGNERIARLRKLEVSKSYDLNVYFHVISEDDTLDGGNITDSSIHRQLDILNEAFFELNVGWTLVNITRTINADWFNNAAENTPQQTAMKKALRQGSAANLNVYSVRLNENTFGYATSPFQYQSNPSDDGVVIRSATVPGEKTFFEHTFAQALGYYTADWIGVYSLEDRPPFLPREHEEKLESVVLDFTFDHYLHASNLLKTCRGL
ncbi:hypothetical protein H0H92_012701 [Tricholoma furcatifolium]|nr:hypothetical protein H0H92_012701 [Tricholoma furcatifolium]